MASPAGFGLSRGWVKSTAVSRWCGVCVCVCVWFARCVCDSLGVCVIRSVCDSLGVCVIRSVCVWFARCVCDSLGVCVIRSVCVWIRRGKAGEWQYLATHVTRACEAVRVCRPSPPASPSWQSSFSLVQPRSASSSLQLHKSILALLAEDVWVYDRLPPLWGKLPWWRVYTNVSNVSPLCKHITECQFSLRFYNFVSFSFFLFFFFFVAPLSLCYNECIFMSIWIDVKQSCFHFRFFFFFLSLSLSLLQWMYLYVGMNWC